MSKTTGTINISNTSQGTVSLNCSYREGENLVTIFHDILPARECITGKAVPIEDWNRVKGTDIVARLIEAGTLLSEKRKVTIDQETWKASDPKPTGELADASLSNLVRGNSAQTVKGSRKAKTNLKGG